MTNLQIRQALFRLAGVTSTTTRADITAAVKIAIQRAQTKFVLAYDWALLETYQDHIDVVIAAPYNTGTVAVTIDSKTITGTGTAWTKDMEGSYFQLNSQEWYELRTFNSATSFDLDIPFQSATATLQGYQIVKRFYNLPLNFFRPHVSQMAQRTVAGLPIDTSQRYRAA